MRQEKIARKISLDLENVRIDADPVVVAGMVHNLINNPDYRKVFEDSPAECLEECGIMVDPEIRKQMTTANISKALDSLKERIGPEEVAFVPGVAPAVRVGTSPGVRVGVQVGVESAVATAVIGARIDPRSGLKKRR